MSTQIRTGAPRIRIRPIDALWDAWVLAEMGAELSLYIWFTAPSAEREAAHGDYLDRLADEEHAAFLLEQALADGVREVEAA
jgi:hypothetical protein